MTHKCHECGDYYYGDECTHCRIQCKGCGDILHGKVNNKLVDFERWRSPSGDYYCNDSLCYQQELIKETIVSKKCPHPNPPLTDDRYDCGKCEEQGNEYYETCKARFNPICINCECCEEGALIVLTQDDYYYCCECWNSDGRLNTLKRLGWTYYR